MDKEDQQQQASVDREESRRINQGIGREDKTTHAKEDQPTPSTPSDLSLTEYAEESIEGEHARQVQRVVLWTLTGGFGLLLVVAVIYAFRTITIDVAWGSYLIFSTGIVATTAALASMAHAVKPLSDAKKLKD